MVTRYAGSEVAGRDHHSAIDGTVSHQMTASALVAHRQVALVELDQLLRELLLEYLRRQPRTTRLGVVHPADPLDVEPDRFLSRRCTDNLLYVAVFDHLLVVPVDALVVLDLVLLHPDTLVLLVNVLVSSGPPFCFDQIFNLQEKQKFIRIFLAITHN